MRHWTSANMITAHSVMHTHVTANYKNTARLHQISSVCNTFTSVDDAASFRRQSSRNNVCGLMHGYDEYPLRLYNTCMVSSSSPNVNCFDPTFPFLSSVFTSIMLPSLD